jgi:hypothetical protein
VETLSKPIIEEYEVLYHYTTAAGLVGIIDSQALRATSIGYLNDAEEHTGFYDHKLPAIIREAATEVIHEAIEDPHIRARVDALGGPDEVISRESVKFLSYAREITLAFNDPYVTSFSGPPAIFPEDGLLSQWRAYGPDGGYAIVFDCKGLNDLLNKEFTIFYYAMATWSDVHYDLGQADQSPLPEVQEYVEKLKRAMMNFFNSGKQSDLDPMLEPLTLLSVLRKHAGFREEREVRIVALRANAEVEALARQSGDQRPTSPVMFRERNGVIVPYLELFGRELGADTKLPIKKIIVGPHTDKEKRRVAVERLLQQKGIEAEVSISSIPFLGP